MKNKPTVLLGSAFFSLLIIFLVSIRTAQADSARRLRIGFIAPLSGSLAEFGYAIKNGVTLAKESNPAADRLIDDHYEDSRYDSKTSITNFHKLREIDKVHTMYVFGGPISDTLAPIAEKYHLPTFSTEYDVRYTRGMKYVFRFANNASDYAQALIWQLSSRGLNNFGIIKVENQYHNTLSDAFINNLKEGQQVEVIENFQPSETDFRSAFVRIRGHSFDALGIYLTPGMQHNFLSQLNRLQLPLQLFGTDSFESREENRSIENFVEGTLYANSAVSKVFADQYNQRFGDNSQVVHAALAYEFTMLLVDLFEKSTIPNNPDEFVQRFRLKQGRESICGKYYFREESDTGKYFSFPIAVREVRNGSPVVIDVQPAP